MTFWCFDFMQIDELIALTSLIKKWFMKELEPKKEIQIMQFIYCQKSHDIEKMSLDVKGWLKFIEISLTIVTSLKQFFYVQCHIPFPPIFLLCMMLSKAVAGQIRAFVDLLFVNDPFRFLCEPSLESKALKKPWLMLCSDEEPTTGLASLLADLLDVVSTYSTFIPGENSRHHGYGSIDISYRLF